MDARFFDQTLEVEPDAHHPDAKAAEMIPDASRPGKMRPKPIERLLIELHVSDTLHPVRVATDEDKVTYADAYKAYLVAKK